MSTPKRKGPQRLEDWLAPRKKSDTKFHWRQIHPKSNLEPDFETESEEEETQPQTLHTLPQQLQSTPTMPAMEEAGPAEPWYGKNLYEPTGNVRDPIHRRNRKIRFAAAQARREKYGAGTMADLKRRYAAIEYNSDPTLSATKLAYERQMMARLNDGYTGRGRYKKRRRYRGRGMYTAGAVGRGMYYAGATPHYSGRGSFWDSLKSARKKVVGAARKVYHQTDKFADMAETAAGWMGQPELAGAIEMARKGIKGTAGAIGGRGSYNTLFPELGPSPVTFDSMHSEHGNLVVTGSEKVSDIFGNSSGVNYSQFDVPLYPGNFEHFPRLAQHAADFKEYEFVQLIFVYKSTIPPNWSTTSVTTGKVIMATQMDVSRPQWTTYDELYAVENKTEGLVTGMSEDDRMHTHGIECSPESLTNNALKFVRTKALLPHQNYNDYDLGRFSFGMFGTSSDLDDKMVGELWVQYKVIFKNHRMYSSLGLAIPQSLIKNETTSYNIGSNAITYTSGTADASISKWLDILDFKNSPTAKPCLYNNIDFDCQSFVTTPIQNLNTTGYSQLNWFYGFHVKLTFPTSLRGDYEIEINVYGDNLLPTDRSMAGAGVEIGGFEALSTEEFYPDITGTVILNQDIAVPWTGANTTEYPSQRAQIINFSTNNIRVMAHIHLGQAVSTIDNTVSMFVPIIGNTNGQDSMAAAMAATGGTTGNPIYVSGSTLSIRQYNAQQIIGSGGMPY